MNLATLIFGLYSPGARLEEWGNSTGAYGNLFWTKKDASLTLVTNSLCVNGFESLEGVDVNPLDLVFCIHRDSANGAYLTLSMVGALISVKKFLKIAKIYPGLPPVESLDKASLEIYLYLWTSAKQSGILTCEEKIVFDCAPESWPVFCI